MGQRLHTHYATPAPRARSRAERWRLALVQFAFYLDQGGPSQRRMATNRICPRRVWDCYTWLMVRGGVLVQDRRGTRWAEGWNRHRLRLALLHGYGTTPRPLPFPTEWDPPRLFDFS